ncbi:hypothetical protein, partial [Thermogutta sp.]|uniref:hypothetical protein n=1 Tax=Thermogutta sp. TaxID=1962930 RepID=UPI00321FAC2F
MAADQLLALGPVSVVVADGTSTPRIASNPTELHATLALLRQVEVVNWQSKLRRESQWLGLYGTRGIDSENFPEEVVRVRRQLRILRKNLAAYAPGKRVAFLVWDGLEVNPLATGSAHGSQERDPIPTSWRFSNLEEMRGIAELCESLGVPLISLFPGF